MRAVGVRYGAGPRTVLVVCAAHERVSDDRPDGAGRAAAQAAAKESLVIITNR